METYTINFENNTPDTWTLCVYMTLPDSPGITSVSWKQTTVPPSGKSDVQWQTSYQACLSNYYQEGGKGVHKASQSLETDLGEQWQATFESNVQQLRDIGPTTPGMVTIKNNSTTMANLGIGLDGNIALVQRNVYVDNSAQFVVTPTFWVAVYSDLTLGEQISGDQVHAPIQVKFGGGITALDFAASIEGDKFVFEQKMNRA